MWFKYTRENLVVKKVVVFNHLMTIQCFYSSHTANRELLVCFTNHKLNEIIKNILISCIFLKTTVHFSSEANRDLFLKKPEKYVPAYNGFCAYAMAENGKIYSSNPKAFKVIDGKVYLFYKKPWANTLKKWNKKNNDSGLILKADEYWNRDYLAKPSH